MDSGNPQAKPGEVILTDGKLYIACSNGNLEVRELQEEGKRRLSSSEFLRGHKIEPGEIWG